MPLGSTVPSQFLSEVFRLFDGSDVTKKVKFILSGITSENVRVLTIPDQNGVISLEGHAHSNISVVAGSGLSGGGVLGESRTLALDITEFDEDVSPVAATDYLVTYDDSASAHKKVLLTNVLESVNSFIELGDTPTSYDSADIDKILVVKSDLSGLEFTDSPTFDMLRLENQIQFFPKTLQPLITFIFDDGHDTTLSIAKPVFDAQGEVACSAPISDYIGTGNYLDSIELNTLQNAGWEILSHSKSHIDLTTLSNAEIITELLESKQALEALGLTIRNFVYPFGTSNEIVRRLTRSYYRSARAIGGEGLINAQVLDTFKLRAYNADDHTKLAEYQAQVDIAESGNQWLIFYFHAVDSDDATMLNTLIDYIQAKNIDVVTVNEALDLVGNVIDVGDNFAVNEAGIRANFVQGMVGLGVIPTSTLSIGSYDKVERLDIHHTNVNAHFKTSKGLYLFQTDEGTNTNSYLVVKGKGSGRGYLYAYDEDDAEAIEIRCSLGHGYIRMIGASPGSIHLQDGAHSDVRLFANSAEGETKELRIYGRRTGDDRHQLSIGVGVDAADTASFSNVGNYRFNGILQTIGLTVGSLAGILKGTNGVVSAITDNSGNWNTAYGWGDHAGLYDSAGTMTTHEGNFTHSDIALNTTHRGLSSGNPHSVTPTELSLVIGTNVQAADAGLLSLAGLSYAAAAFVKMTGTDTFVLRTIGETADDLEATIDHNNLDNGGAHDYSYISGNDGNTNVTGLELEELTDGSQTILHSHAGAGATFLDLTDTPTSYDSADIGKYLRLKDDLSGLEFDTPAGGNGGFTSRCRVCLTSLQSVPTGVYTKLLLATEQWDNDSEWASNRFTAKAAGYYHVSYNARISSFKANGLFIAKIYKNGAEYSIASYRYANVSLTSLAVIGADDVYLNGSTDYIEIYVYHNHGSNRDFTNGTAQNFVAIHRFA